MRSYFITVRNEADALAVDPQAQLIRTLPATLFIRDYCCRQAETHPVSEAYIYQVRVKNRRAAEKAKGVIRCRAKEPKSYKTTIYTQVC